MTEVYLAIYDLSHGMARNLSAQFLGPNHVIDMIPHTALLVFGKEYYFGGGIQCVDPSSFRAMSGMSPVQTQRLGITTVSQSDFDAWCQGTICSHKFNVQTYDLLQCNCNHFSQEAATVGLHLSKNVFPEWILQVPQRFLSSPMGQMIRPMLEQMQVTQTMAPAVGGVGAGVGQAAAAAHHHHHHHHPPAASSLPPPNLATTTTVMTSTIPSSVATLPISNPWATLPVPTKPAASSYYSPVANIAASPLPPHKPATTPNAPPLQLQLQLPSILNKYTQPMISNDTKSVSLCVSKLAPHMSNEEACSALNQMSQKLLRLNHGEQNNAARLSRSEEATPTIVITELWRLIREGTCTSFALLLLRLVVLVDCTSSSELSLLQDCMEWMVQQLFLPMDDCVWTTPAARSLAWCVVSNYASNTATRSVLPTDTVEAAIRDWNHTQTQVRQAACTFLYNFVLTQGQPTSNSTIFLELEEETMVSIVCSSLESLVEEMDATTRLRRLLILGRVVFRVDGTEQEVAKALVQDLGVCDILKEILIPPVDGDDSNAFGDAKLCQQLATELIGKLQ